MSVRAVCVSSAPRSDLSRLSKHKIKGFLWCFAALYGGVRGAYTRIGYKCLQKKDEKKKLDLREVNR